MAVEEIDFEAEGLLEGLEGEARDARLALLTDLHADGVELDELRQAVEEDRLALLPVERALTGDGPFYTRAEVAEKTGLEVKTLEKFWRALGMPLTDDDAAVFTDDDVDAVERVKAMLDLGIPEDDLLEISRLLGISMSQFAAANRNLARRVFPAPGDDEHEIAVRYAEMQRELAPMLAPVMAHILGLHMREQIRSDVFDGVDEANGTVELAVCFADLVDFTKLGERIEPSELSGITARLGELASEVASGSVRIVKLIGDAVMLVSSKPAELVSAAIDLVNASEAAGDEFPLLRAGAALGSAVTRGGDYYGHPVNLASRITGVARPGSVLIDEVLQEKVADDFNLSFAGERHLKGISHDVKLYRARRPKQGSDED